jgi:hypothetical protein
MRLQTPIASRSAQGGGGRGRGRERDMGERSNQRGRCERNRGEEAFGSFALPGDGLGVRAVEVPELLHLADELAQCGHLPHRLAAGAASTRRRRPPRRTPSLPHSLSSSSGGCRVGASARLSPPSLSARLAKNQERENQEP